MSASTKNQTANKNNKSINRKENQMKTTETKIKVSRIRCTPDRKVTKETIEQRAKSIDSIGLIHSIKIQPIDDKKFDYEVVAGRTSFLAMTTILKRTELILGGDNPELNIIKGDADLIAFVENHERVNLTLWEEVNKLEALKNKFKTIETLATELGKSNTWVARRINLFSLTDTWKKAMQNNEFAFGIGHYEIIATFPESIQQEIYNRFDYNRIDDNISIRKLQTLLNDTFATPLSKLPWNKDGQEKGCGTCPACIDRANGGFLFDEMNNADNAICMNSEYLQEKMNQFLLEEVETSKTNDEKIILISDYYTNQSQFDNSEVAEKNEWIKTTKKDGGQKALMVDGPQAGYYIYISFISQQEEENEKQPKKVRSLAERKELKNRQRQRWAINQLMEHIKTNDYKVPERDVIFTLIAILGIRNTFSCEYEAGNYISPLTKYDKIFKQKNLDNAVWKVLTEEILRNLKYGQSGTCPACWEEAQIISSLIDYNLDEAFTAAVEALPDPKSWAKLEAEENKEQEAA